MFAGPFGIAMSRQATQIMRRKRRGLTIIEVVLSGTLMLAVVFILAGISRFVANFWQQGMSATSTQMSSQMALQRIAPTIRAARRVVVEKSTSTKLTVRLPAYDSSGSLVIPIVDGNEVAYYLSNTTGYPVTNGTILWRSVNGIPDSSWSMGSATGRVALKTGGLSFSYYPTANPESVTVNIVATKVTGTRTDTLPTSQEVVLRNKDL